MKTQDKKKISQLEASFKDQLTERNNLLLILWTRLSAMCGTDWAHDNSLINGRALPSLEAVATMLPGFSKNLLAAVKAIEGMIGGFQSRIKGVERDLWREYQILENNLDVRTKKLDRLETIVRTGVAAGTIGPNETQSRMARLEEAYRQLKVENATLRTANDVRSRAAYSATGDPNGLVPEGSGGGSPSPSIPTGPRDKERSRKPGTSNGRPSTMSRTTTTTTTTSNGASTGLEVALSDREGGPDRDNRWMFRLRDLEYKLKMEREARNQDRSAARQRLGGLELENRDLRGEVARMKQATGESD
jgi:cell division protein FtsB